MIALTVPSNGLPRMIGGSYSSYPISITWVVLFGQEQWLKSTILTSLSYSDHLSWLGPHLLVPVPPIGPLPWFMSGLLWNLCSLVLEGKRLLLPLDVETDLGSTSVDDSSQGVQEWPPNSDAEVLDFVEDGCSSSCCCWCSLHPQSS